MEALPIKSVREEDAPVIGLDLFNLAKLSWLDFPVADGVIVLPPQLKIRTLLEHFQFKDGEVFEQKLTLLQSQIKQIPIPEDLEKTLAHHKQSFSSGKVNTKKLWSHLLEFWINELRSKIWREGFSTGLSSGLSAQSVFFTAKVYASGISFFNRDLDAVVFETEHGELTETQKKELGELVKKADKKLFLPQIYGWVIEKGVKFIKTTPLTHSPIQAEMDDLIPPEFSEEKLVSLIDQVKLKSTVKVFLQTDHSFKTELEADGAIINSENQFEEDGKILHLAETAQTLSGKPVIFKLSDNPKNQLRGALQLIHRTNLLADEAQIVKFVRHKKHLSNVAVAIPFIRSPEELVRLKVELSSLGISRQGNLRLWLELAVPENLINLEDYLNKGIDGVLINTDELSVRIGGFDPEAEEGIFYRKQVNAFLKLLEPSLKLLHKEHIPAIVTGSLAIHDDVLDFLLEKGIYGISVDFSNFLSIHERLRLIEKRIVKSRTGN